MNRMTPPPRARMLSAKAAIRSSMTALGSPPDCVSAVAYLELATTALAISASARRGGTGSRLAKVALPS